MYVPEAVRCTAPPPLGPHDFLINQQQVLVKAAPFVLQKKPHRTYGPFAAYAIKCCHWIIIVIAGTTYYIESHFLTNQV